MAKKMGAGLGKDPASMRSKPNPSLRPGTGTVDMAKAMLKGGAKKKKGAY